jgi:hypothetical protein
MAGSPSKVEDMMGASLRRAAKVGLGVGAVCLFGGLTPPVAAQRPVPVGSEFQVNTFTTSYQRYPSVSLDAEGNFVVVWTSHGSSGTDSDVSVQGQLYAADGTPLGVEFQVNTFTTSSQVRPSVSVDADGDFVVVWQSLGSSGTDTDGPSVQGQRYAVPTFEVFVADAFDLRIPEADRDEKFTSVPDTRPPQLER